MMQKDEELLELKNDDREKIGIDFFQIEESLKTKILILHSHLKLDDHPIKMLITVFRNSLRADIFKKSKNIK